MNPIHSYRKKIHSWTRVGWRRLQFISKDCRVQSLLCCYSSPEKPTSSSEEQHPWRKRRSGGGGFLLSWSHLLLLAMVVLGGRSTLPLISCRNMRPDKICCSLFICDVFRLARPILQPVCFVDVISYSAVPPEGNTSLRLHRSLNCHTRLQTRTTVNISPIESLAQRFKARIQTSRFREIKGELLY